MSFLSKYFSLVLCFVFLYSCKNTEEGTPLEEDFHMHLEGFYTCPMHAQIQENHGGICPICKMDLVFQNYKNERYTLDPVFSPSPLEINSAGELILTPKILNPALEKTALSIVHEQKMHVIVVKEDLSTFQHLHPLERQDSSFALNIIPPIEFLEEKAHEYEMYLSQEGKYVLFAEFSPVGDRGQLFAYPFEIGKENNEKQPLFANNEHLSPLTFSVLEEMIFQENCSTKLSFSIYEQKNGKPTELLDPAFFDNYLGEKAHIVGIDESTQHFIHIHPSIKEGKIIGHTSFPKAGNYKIWLQYKKEGMMIIQDFVVEVAPTGAHHYTCPMQCEKKTYDCPGICSVCKMELMPTSKK